MDTLKKKIEDILKEGNTVDYNEDGPYEYFDSYAAANAIEILCLETVKSELNNIFGNDIQFYTKRFGGLNN